MISFTDVIIGEGPRPPEAELHHRIRRAPLPRHGVNWTREGATGTTPGQGGVGQTLQQPERRPAPRRVLHDAVDVVRRWPGPATPVDVGHGDGASVRCGPQKYTPGETDQATEL